MKKYLVLLIIPLLFFSTGCNEEDDTPQLLSNEIYSVVEVYDSPQCSYQLNTTSGFQNSTGDYDFEYFENTFITW